MGNQEYVNIKWQDGTIPEVGRNGVQVAEAIEVVLNQLKIYQERFPCRENAISITIIMSIKKYTYTGTFNASDLAQISLSVK